MDCQCLTCSEYGSFFLLFPSKENQAPTVEYDVFSTTVHMSWNTKLNIVPCTHVHPEKVKGFVAGEVIGQRLLRT